jgi:hypothetical protein
MRFGGIDIDQFFGGYMCRTGVDRIMHEMTIFEINYRADYTGYEIINGPFPKGTARARTRTGNLAEYLVGPFRAEAVREANVGCHVTSRSMQEAPHRDDEESARSYVFLWLSGSRKAKSRSTINRCMHRARRRKCETGSFLPSFLLMS